MSSKSSDFELVEKDKFQGLNSDWIVCNLNPWVQLEWEQTSSFISLLLEKIYKRHILMLKTHDSLETKKPTYHNSLSHVTFAEYLGYTEDFEKGKKKYPLPFLVSFCKDVVHQFMCDAIHLRQELL